MRTILAGLAALFMIIIPYSEIGWAEEKSPAPKFLQENNEILGLNLRELEALLGKPNVKHGNGCRVPMDDKDTMVVGDAWVYTLETESSKASLQLCLVKDTAVAFTRKLAVVSNGVVKINTQENLSVRLILQLVRDNAKSGIIEPFKLSNRGILI